MNDRSTSLRRIGNHGPNRNARTPRARLVCLPYAGGTAKSYDPLGAALAGVVEVHAAEYAGRGMRFGEPVPRSIGETVEQLGQDVLPLLDRPYALFGYSMGALVAFELARWLRTRGARAPAHLIVCAARSPHVVDPRPSTYRLPDKHLLAELRALGGVPSEMWQHPELLAMLVPIVRADLEAVQTYRYRDEAPLDVPIAAYVGARDPLASRDEVEAWRARTRAAFELTVLEGGHFFWHGKGQAFFSAVAKVLTRSLGA